MFGLKDMRARVRRLEEFAKENAQEASAIEDHPDHFAPVALRYLVAYPDSYAQGEGVVEAFPESIAATEVRALFAYLINQLGGGAHG